MVGEKKAREVVERKESCRRKAPVHALGCLFRCEKSEKASQGARTDIPPSF